MPKPRPDQEVFDSQVFRSAENIFECRDRMNQMKEDRAASGFLRSPGKDGISRRLFMNRSPILKGREKWVPQLGTNTGSCSPTSIKVE